MNTTNIIEKIPVGEIVIEEADSSPKCKVEVRYFKYWTNPRRFKEKVVKPKKAKKIVNQEIRRDRNRTKQRKCRDRKRSLKQALEAKNPPKILPKNPPKNPPLTSAERSKRYRDKKKNLKNI